MKYLFIPPVFFLLTIILCVLSYFLFPGLNVIPFPFNLAGILISLTGFVIMGKARDLFGKHQTTLTMAKSSFLIKDGVFSKTRNPMYCGMFLLLLGIGICFRNVFSILAPLVFLFIIALFFVPKEEQLLLESFGQEYLDYRKTVKRWF